MTKRAFDTQELLISTDRWSVALEYESSISKTKETALNESDIIIPLSEKEAFGAALRIEIFNQSQKRVCLVTGVQGGIYLYKKENNSEGQSVKIDKDNLILSLGPNFISIDLICLTKNWQLQPDMAEVFEFYDLENDYLLRGEVGIHRIDKSGKIKWTFSAGDIWVNMEGKSEVEFAGNTIKLIDFNSKEYIIDFDGKQIQPG